LEPVEDGWFIGKLNNGTKFPTQSWNEDYNFADHIVDAGSTGPNKEYPTPLKYMLLRLPGIDIFNNRILGNSFKKMIAKRSMTAKRRLDGMARGNSYLNPMSGNYQGEKFRAVHMRKNSIGVQSSLCQYPRAAPADLVLWPFRNWITQPALPLIVSSSQQCRQGKYFRVTGTVESANAPIRVDKILQKIDASINGILKLRAL